MASTLDSALKSVQSSFEAEAVAILNGTLNDILHGRTVDPKDILLAAQNTVNRAIGTMINQSINAVNQQVAQALGNTFRNSKINIIAGNYAGSVLKGVIVGNGIPPITRLMTTQIGQGLSKELYARLPAGLTKSINVDILGTNVGQSLAPVINRALNGAVDAVVSSIFDGAPLSDALMNSFPSMKDVADLSGLTKLVDAAYSKVDETLGTIDNFINFASTISEVPIEQVSGAFLLDLERYVQTNAPAGRMITLANTPLGENKSNLRGMAKEEYQALQQNLAESNIAHPLADLGGKFEGMDEVIRGIKTNSGVRAVTTNLAEIYHTIRTEFGLQTEEEKQAEEVARDRTEELGIILGERALSEAAQFNATSNDQLEKLTTMTEGFKDPNAIYPTPEYADRSDVNKLATRDPNDTIQDNRENDRHVGAKLPNGQSWDQPASSYNARYPYNHVQESESGHVIEIDDTPGAERLHTRHRTGTGHEIDPIGNIVKTIKGSDYTIIDKNGYISIVGRANVSVGGGALVHIAADAHIEVGGNAYIISGNNIELGAAGAIKIAAAERIDLKSRDICIDADNSISMNADVALRIHGKEINAISDTDIKIEAHNDFKLEVSANTDIKTTGTTKVTSTGAMDVKAEAVVHIESTADMHIKSGANLMSSASGDYHAVAGGALFNTSGGANHTKAGGAINEDGATINMNSGGSAAGTEAGGAASAGAAGAAETEYSTANYPSGGRIAVDDIPVHEAPAKHYAASEVVSKTMNAITSGRTGLDDEEKADIVGGHAIDPSVIDRNPVEDTNAKGSKRSPSQPKTIIMPEEMPIGDKIPPDNLKLSPHFTLGDLTTKAVNGNKLQTNGGVLAMSKIVCNLQYLALNILEPIYAVRPDLVIDTCFKPYNMKSKKQDKNNFGLSISLDFKNAAKHSDYYDIANVLQHVCTFDEMILWYMTADFIKSNKESGLLVFNVSGVFNPMAGSNPSSLPTSTKTIPTETKVT